MIVFFDIGNCLYDPYRTFRRSIAAVGRDDVADKMLAEVGTYPDQPGRHDPMLQAYGLTPGEIETYFREFTNNPVYHLGSPDILTRLRERGVQLGVLSDGHFDTQIGKLQAWGVSDLIDAAMIFIGSGPDEHGRAPGVYPRGTQLAGTKYDVETFHTVFKSVGERLDIAPDQCVMVGDDYVRDALHAIEAGWKGIWFVPNQQAANTLPQDGAVTEVPKIVDLNELDRLLFPEE